MFDAQICGGAAVALLFRSAQQVDLQNVAKNMQAKRCANVHAVDMT
jgi:hypothetical protein